MPLLQFAFHEAAPRPTRLGGNRFCRASSEPPPPAARTHRAPPPSPARVIVLSASDGARLGHAVRDLCLCPCRCLEPWPARTTPARLHRSDLSTGEPQAIRTVGRQRISRIPSKHPKKFLKY
ncbi:unnamed protein product, partial [Iphiclides podalirius]